MDYDTYLNRLERRYLESIDREDSLQEALNKVVHQINSLTYDLEELRFDYENSLKELNELDAAESYAIGSVTRELNALSQQICIVEEGIMVLEEELEDLTARIEAQDEVREPER